MDVIILWSFIFLILLLNVAIGVFYKNGKLNLIFSGLIMLILAPIIGFTSGALFLHFYDFSSGGTGEGAGYGGAFLGLITLANGIVILAIGIIMWLVRLFRRSLQK